MCIKRKKRKGKGREGGKEEMGEGRREQVNLDKEHMRLYVWF